MNGIKNIYILDNNTGIAHVGNAENTNELDFEKVINVNIKYYTPLQDKWIKTSPNPKETLSKINSKIPLGIRMTTTEEIANMVAFLLSDKSSHTTGQMIHVDGGYVHLDRSFF